MWMNFVVLISFARFSVAAVNGTDCAVNVPGYTHNGNCNLLCRPPAWTDMVFFYLGNYVAHAATVVGQPGESLLSTALTIFMVLVFPGAGSLRGIRAIKSLAIFAPTELQTAARAGALCTVIKEGRGESSDPDTPDGGSDVEQKGVAEPDRSHAWPQEDLEDQKDRMPFMATNIHGLCKLPKGYSLVVLPDDAKFVDEEEEDKSLPFWDRLKHAIKSPFVPESSPRTSLSCNRNMAAVLISVVQLLFAISTLYDTLGDQIAIYGYAAFGLTVAQYAWMSLVNLLGNLLCPQYPAMFLVESNTLDELRAQITAQDKASQFLVTETVGRITQETEEKVRAHYLPKLRESSEVVSGENPSASFREQSVRIQGSLSSIRLLEQVMMVIMRAQMKATNLAAILVAAVPLAVVGGLSHFSPGTSDLYQRVWTMMWLVLGILIGPVFAFLVEAMVEPRPLLGKGKSVLGSSADVPFWALCVSLFFGIGGYSAPAVGGFVVVGQMLMQFGVCNQLP